MFKRTIIAALASAALVVASGGAALATECEPPPEVCYGTPIHHDAVTHTETVIDTPGVDAYDEVVEVSAAGWQRYSWTGGPVEGDIAPAFPGEGWQANVAGDPHGVGVAGAYFRSHGGSGNGDWFYLEAVKAVTQTIHHDAVPPVTHDVVITDAEAYDEPVVVPCQTEEPPTTYEPTCTTVTGSQNINGDGVFNVAGDWDSESVAVLFSGTLADVGTVFDINPYVQYLGLHIDTAEGTIVYEEIYGGTNLWSESSWDGVTPGMGYAAFGSIEEYVLLNGDVAVTGIRLLYTSPTPASTTVSNFTIGCTTFTFRPVVDEPPVEEPPVETPPVVTPPVVTPPVVEVLTPVTPTPTPTTAPVPNSELDSDLAETGSNGAVPLALLAGVLLLVGAGVKRLSRR